LLNGNPIIFKAAFRKVLLVLIQALVLLLEQVLALGQVLEQVLLQKLQVPPLLQLLGNSF
jgi:hypothetical protein